MVVSFAIRPKLHLVSGCISPSGLN